MKLKKLSFLAGAIALTLTAIPFTAEAQSNSEQPIVVAQKKARKEGWWKQLNLTEQQKTQMQAIKESARAQMEEVLTPQQLQKLEEAKANGKKKREIYQELNLTDAQKAEMRKIKESKKSQIQDILTEEQKQQLRQMRQNRRSRRQQSAS